MTLTGYWYEDRDGLYQEAWTNTQNVWGRSRAHRNGAWRRFELKVCDLSENSWRARRVANRIEELPAEMLAVLVSDMVADIRYAYELYETPEWEGRYCAILARGRVRYNSARYDPVGRVLLERKAKGERTRRHSVREGVRVSLVPIDREGDCA